MDIGGMDIRGWDQRYRSGERPKEDLEAAPTPLVVRIAQTLAAGEALDLACGAGRNALWLARHKWKVTAVDGSEAAIDILRERAARQGLKIDARVADLEGGDYRIESGRWDLISICYYLQLDLIDCAKAGLKAGGVLIVIVHIGEEGEPPSKHSLQSGELIRHFDGWEILHSFEGRPEDAAHKRSVAEVAVRRPSNSGGGDSPTRPPKSATGADHPKTADIPAEPRDSRSTGRTSGTPA
jgi:tellurite methyltransferase